MRQTSLAAVLSSFRVGHIAGSHGVQKRCGPVIIIARSLQANWLRNSEHSLKLKDLLAWFGQKTPCRTRVRRRELIMPTNADDIIGKLSANQRKNVEVRAAQLIAEEMTLRELRHARKLTQVRMAKTLGITQDSVSRLERRSDLLFSTLRKKSAHGHA
jgi:DNA-binding XRE family transcriptional regulator